MDDISPSLLPLSVQIVSAYVAHNSVPAEDLPALAVAVHGALTAAHAPPAVSAAPLPAVPVSRSVQRDYLICLEDGKPFKALKRHLATQYRMSPDDYRAKWGLPRDYPMVAPAYSEKRSELAKRHRLGQRSARDRSR